MLARRKEFVAVFAQSVSLAAFGSRSRFRTAVFNGPRQTDRFAHLSCNAHEYVGDAHRLASQRDQPDERSHAHGVVPKGRAIRIVGNLRGVHVFAVRGLPTIHLVIAHLRIHTQLLR